jgi:hypothetical protein
MGDERPQMQVIDDKLLILTSNQTKSASKKTLDKGPSPGLVFGAQQSKSI